MIESKPVFINLLGKDRNKYKRFRAATISCIGGSMLAALLAGPYLCKLSEFEQQSDRHHLLQVRIEEVSKSSPQEYDLQVLPNQLLNKKERVKHIEEQSMPYVQTFVETEKCISEGLSISKIAVESGQVTIRGSTHSFNDMVKLTSRLGKANAIKNIALVSASLVNNTGQIEFEISAEWSAPRK